MFNMPMSSYRYITLCITYEALDHKGWEGEKSFSVFRSEIFILFR